MALGTAGLVLGPVMALGDKGGKSLPRTTPGAVGVNADAVAAFVDEVNRVVGGLHSMMLLRHGKVAAEAWWTPYQPAQTHMLYSLSKSFTSTAVGMAVAEGRLTVEDKVVSFFPDKLPEKVSDNLAAMRVKDLLTMSTGHDKEPGIEPPDWVKTFLAAPVAHAPGTHFLYNTPATHVLSAIVQKLTGERLLTYLTPRLFEPLGIEGATWDQSPAGIDAGGFGLMVRTEDIAKFGQLYLQKGQWEGKPLIKPEWVEEATRKEVSNGDPSQENDWSQGYGYQFWRCQHDNFRGDGAFGQYCVVMPAHDAVLAITSGVGDMGAVLKAAWTHLLPGMKEGIPAGDEAALKKKLHDQVVPPPSGAPSSPTAAEVSGKTFTLNENADGIKTYRFAFHGDRLDIERTDKEGTRRLPCGTKEWVRSEIEENGKKRPVATRGAWTTDHKFSIAMCYLDSPHAWLEAYEFEGNKLTVGDRKLNIWFGPTDRPALTGTAA